MKMKKKNTANRELLLGYTSNTLKDEKQYFQ